MKRLLFFLLLLLVLSCSQKVQDDTKSKYGGIFGVVADRATGDPVSVVQLKLTPSNKTTVTGTDGSYSFQNIEPGEYSISTEKLGYRQSNNITTVVAGQTSECHLLVERIPAVITADVEELDFGKELSNNSMSFNIVNEYYEDLNWHIEYNCDWIESVVPAKGTCTHGKTASVVVNVNRFYSKKGNNETRLTIVSDNGNGRCEVVLRLYNTLSSEARIETLEATNIGSDHATLNAEVSYQGNPVFSEKGFVFSTSSNPTLDDCIKSIPVNGSQFSATINGLNLNVRYYVKAYAKHALYIVYGNTVSFETNNGYKKCGQLYVQANDAGYGTYQSMKSLCESSNVGGLTGWRLPTRSELSVLYQNKSSIGGFHEDCYWSGDWEKVSGYGSFPYYRVYYMYFKNGSIGYEQAENTWPGRQHYARCVK